MTLPDLIRLVIFIGFNILWGWNRNKYSSDFDLYGWLTLANGGLTLLFAARTNIFAIVARIPSTTLLMYHRWAGRATVIHATIHFGSLVRSYIKSGQFAIVLQTVRIQVGLMAWISLCLILLTSISFVRRRWFEGFYYPHALFLLFVVGALIHASHAAEFIVPGLALWGIDRLIRFTHNFRRIEVISATQYPGDLTKFKIRGLRTHHPGQIAWVQIPEASLLNWHPFTVASAPSADKEATFAIRGLGNYTKRVQSVAGAASQVQGMKQGKPTDPAALRSLRMRVDGPYGVGHIQWGVHPVTVLVAGGIGITPGISIASHILEQARRSEAQPASGLKWHVHILWVVKAPQHVAWFEEELARLAALAADPLVPATLDLHIYVTGDKAADIEAGDSSAYEMSTPPSPLPHLPVGAYLQHDALVAHPVQHGRPDMRAYFRGVREMHPGLDAVVSACGPRPLIDAVRRAAVAGEGDRRTAGAYHVEAEVFEL